jgi:hypothetical protein
MMAEPDSSTMNIKGVSMFSVTTFSNEPKKP